VNSFSAVRFFCGFWGDAAAEGGTKNQKGREFRSLLKPENLDAPSLCAEARRFSSAIYQAAHDLRTTGLKNWNAHPSSV
jgi:hypothetical protein